MAIDVMQISSFIGTAKAFLALIALFAGYGPQHPRSTLAMPSQCPLAMPPRNAPSQCPLAMPCEHICALQRWAQHAVSPPLYM